MAKGAATPRPLRNDLLPLLAISYVSLTTLRQTKRKLRRLDPAHVREVASAIGALGFRHPILVGRDNEIIDGEVRFEAARLLGLDVVPCVQIDDLSPNEQRMLRLAVNRLAEKGEWDLDALKVEFEELILMDAPIEIAGFDEVDQVVLGQDASTVEQGPLAPEEGDAPVAMWVGGSKPGKVATTVMSDERQGGYDIARWTFERMGGKGKVALLQRDKAHQAGALREQGFREALKEFPVSNLCHLIVERDDRIEVGSLSQHIGRHTLAHIAGPFSLAVGRVAGNASAGLVASVKAASAGDERHRRAEGEHADD
jgi:hypothetical protein